jgi:anaerobic selenocysteine-containing dehydrogenase
LVKEDFVRERCEMPSFDKWRTFVAQERNSPEAMEAVTGVPSADVRAPRACMPPPAMARFITGSGSPSTARAPPW